MIILKNTERTLNNDKYVYCFMNYIKCHYIAVTKLNGLLKNLSKGYKDRFCLSCFCDFQRDEKLK